MSWITSKPRSQGFAVNSANRGNRVDTTDCDPKACYDSFCKHWQQAVEIMKKIKPNKPSSHDDIVGVVTHLDHMVTLLLVELHNCNKIALPKMQQTPSPCLEYLLTENVLDKLYEWGISTGRYANAVRLEQLKLYELLVSHSRQQLLIHEPFLRPLLKILASSENEIFLPDIEKLLVILLHQLCVVLMQNVPLLDLFFFSSSQRQDHTKTNFIIFSLLIPYIHRPGLIGNKAREALLLCMKLSQKNSNIATYIAQYSSICPVFVTGLSGLYSLLPNNIEINGEEWHRITQDDIDELPELSLFKESLEFCNAMVEVTHNVIKQQLLDFMYQGFVIPVLGPALLQIFNGSHFQSNVESQISAMAYLELILRTVTEPGLLKIFVKLLLEKDKFDGQGILDILIERLSSPDSRLCIVTLSLFDTILGLYCEDIMLELLLKFLLPCKHIPISHRHKINKINPYTNTIGNFIDLSPEIMKRACDSVAKQQIQPVSKTIGANWNHYGLYSGESLYSNYHAYLFNARNKIAQSKIACERWANLYNYEKLPTNKCSDKTIEMIRFFLNECEINEQNIHCFSNYNNIDICGTDKGKQLDSLQSIGDSSGYESFKYRPEDEYLDDRLPVENIDVLQDSDNHSNNNNNNNNNNNSSNNNNIDNTRSIISIGTGEIRKRAEFCKISNKHKDTIIELDFSEDLFIQGTVTLGPFLNSIWGKLQTFTSNCLYVNLHLTGLISKLSFYPLPLIHSILLRPDIPTTSDTPSFYQVLKILKQQIDAELPVSEDSLQLIDVARSNLIEREFRLTNKSRKSITNINCEQVSANMAAKAPPLITPISSYDPFHRGDTKRKSFSQSISEIFRKPTATTGLSQIYEFFTGISTSNNIQLRDSIVGTSVSGPNSLELAMQSQFLPSNSSVVNVNTTVNERSRDLAQCAVILDEWLKELSAISQEQSIVMLDQIAQQKTDNSTLFT